MDNKNRTKIYIEPYEDSIRVDTPLSRVIEEFREIDIDTCQRLVEKGDISVEVVPFNTDETAFLSVNMEYAKLINNILSNSSDNIKTKIGLGEHEINIVKVETTHMDWFCVTTQRNKNVQYDVKKPDSIITVVNEQLNEKDIVDIVKYTIKLMMGYDKCVRIWLGKNDDKYILIDPEHNRGIPFSSIEEAIEYSKICEWTIKYDI